VQGSAAEDAKENIVAKDVTPGLYLQVQDEDADGDGIVNWADGFNAVGDGLEADDVSAGGSFAPLWFRIPEQVYAPDATLQILYSASSPSKVVMDPHFLSWDRPTDGALRIWTKDAFLPRNGKSVQQGGDFVEPTNLTSRPYTLADTVGFVRQLPHQLVEAFRSTFEEVTMSDVIVHVVDGSHPDPAQQIKTVRDVMGEVDARNIPEIMVFNKSDLVDADQRLVLRGLEPHAVFVSASTGEGIEEFQRLVAATIPDPDVEITAVIPYEHGELVSLLHEHAQILDTDYVESGTRIHARVSVEMANRLTNYVQL
jgi:hypothetical protein